MGCSGGSYKAGLLLYEEVTHGFAQTNVGPMHWWSRVQLQMRGPCGGYIWALAPQEGGHGSRMCKAGNLGRQAELQGKEQPWQEAGMGMQLWDAGSGDSGIPCLPNQGAGGIWPWFRTGLEWELTGGLLQ